MKRITFKAWKEDGVYETDGYLFTYAGLRLVVKRHGNPNLVKYWDVLEYSTGRGIPEVTSRTRKEAMAKAKQVLDRYGSLTVCKVIDAVICSGTGVLNV